MHLQNWTCVADSLRLRRSPADADGLAGDLIAGCCAKERDKACNLLRLNHFTQWDSSHGLLSEFFDAYTGRCSNIAHAGASHFGVRPAGAQSIDCDLTRSEFER